MTTGPDTGDHSGQFVELRKRLISENLNVPYLQFVRSLKPFYAKVWRDLAFGYAMILLSVVLTAVVGRLYVHPVIAGVLGAISVGFWIAYVQLFIHEAAHYNLHENKNRSDFLANLFVAWLVGTTVGKYRRVHLHHHAALGRVDDSEHTYFFPLNLSFVVRGLTGIRAFEVLLHRKQRLDGNMPRQPAQDGTNGPGASAMAAALFHLGVPLIAFALGWLSVAIAWVFGVAMFFPFFGAIRQLLEHRSDKASSARDYQHEPHGAFTRIFTDSLIDRTFGGAGFNRHILHHWEPQISYTNLAEFERYLMATSAAPILQQRRSTYIKTFTSLFSAR